MPDVYLLFQMQSFAFILFLLFLIALPITKRTQSCRWHLAMLKMICVCLLFPVHNILFSIFKMPLQSIYTSLYAQTSVLDSIKTQIIDNENIKNTFVEVFYTHSTLFLCAVFLGIIIKFFWFCICAIKLKKLTGQARSNLDAEIFNNFLIAKNLLNMNCNVIVKTSEHLKSPVTIGLWKPLILLPNKNISTESLLNVFLHELCHIKRKDLLWKWVLALIKTLYWWNPFVYFFSAMFERYIEYSCDEQVVFNFDKDNRKQYASTLLSFSGKQLYCTNSCYTLSLVSEKKILKERLRNIMQTKKSKLRVTLLAISVFLFIVTLCGFTGQTNQLCAEQSFMFKTVEETQNILLEKGLSYIVYYE